MRQFQPSLIPQVKHMFIVTPYFVGNRANTTSQIIFITKYFMES